jgi:hypothetical protein
LRRRERDAAVVAREQVSVLVERKTAHYKAEAAELQGLVEGSTRRALVLQRELDKVRAERGGGGGCSSVMRRV